MAPPGPQDRHPTGGSAGICARKRADDRRRPGRLTRTARAGALALCLLLPLPLSLPAHADISKGCRVPDIFLTFDSDLKRTERLVDRSAPVRILLLGPNPERQALSQKKRTRLELELNRRLPDIRFSIVDEGPSRGLVDDDFERLRGAVDRVQPDLIIWQVGTGDALAATDADAFARTLGRAADWLKGRNIDLVLIDPPFIAGVPHEHLYGRMVDQIDALSDRQGMNVVQQYQATNWLHRSADPALKGMDARLCMPELVAEAIVRAATR
jgi:hypothetical protein